MNDPLLFDNASDYKSSRNAHYWHKHCKTVSLTGLKKMSWNISWIPAILVLLAAVLEARVPTGCVKLQSANSNEYLTVQSLYNSNRRIVKTTNKIAYWNITNYEGGFYRVWNIYQMEFLYAAAANYALDNQRRRVFTWVGGTVADNGIWDIQELECGTYLLRNRYFNEYLMTDNYPVGGSIYTARQVKQYTGQEQFQWLISKCY